MGQNPLVSDRRLFLPGAVDEVILSAHRHIRDVHDAGVTLEEGCQPPTPPRTLMDARKRALSMGLHYVYTGNIADREGSRTLCPGCRNPLIEREGYRIDAYRIDAGGACPVCHHRIVGRFWDRAAPLPFGNRRIPILLHPGS